MNFVLRFRRIRVSPNEEARYENKAAGSSITCGMLAFRGTPFLSRIRRGAGPGCRLCPTAACRGLRATTLSRPRLFVDCRLLVSGRRPLFLAGRLLDPSALWEGSLGRATILRPALLRRLLAQVAD